MFAEGVNLLLDSYSNREATDFISIGDAVEQTTEKLGITVSHSTVARWVAMHGLGHKLEGKKGQWIVDSLLFDDFLFNKEKYICSYNYQV